MNRRETTIEEGIQANIAGLNEELERHPESAQYMLDERYAELVATRPDPFLKRILTAEITVLRNFLGKK